MRHARRARRPLALLMVAGAWVGLAAPAAAGPKNLKTYCISGASTGGSWDWQVNDAGAATVQASAAGLSVTAGLSASGLRDAFVASLGGLEGVPPYIFVREDNSGIGCLPPNAAFLISAQDDFDLLVTAAGSGTPTIVGPPPTGTVSFNPDIFLVPEPTRQTMLAAGVAALAWLRRGRGRA